MNPRVTKVLPTRDYKLELTFSNREKRVFDMKPYLNIGRFVQLQNEALFASVICTMGSIQWQNGLDLCPDTLYEESVPYNKSEKAQGAGHSVKGRKETKRQAG